MTATVFVGSATVLIFVGPPFPPSRQIEFDCYVLRSYVAGQCTSIDDYTIAVGAAAVIVVEIQRRCRQIQLLLFKRRCPSHGRALILGGNPRRWHRRGVAVAVAVFIIIGKGRGGRCSSSLTPGISGRSFGGFFVRVLLGFLFSRPL